MSTRKYELKLRIILLQLFVQSILANLTLNKQQKISRNKEKDNRHSSDTKQRNPKDPVKLTDFSWEHKGRQSNKKWLNVNRFYQGHLKVQGRGGSLLQIWKKGRLSTACKTKTNKNYRNLDQKFKKNVLKKMLKKK